jgi:hypothetical protein
MKEVRAGLEADVKEGFLERVPVGEADTWCLCMVIQPKKNGRARRIVDLARLSKAGRHVSHHIRSAAEIAKSVPAGKLKSTLDCVDGYHGVELAKEDRHNTTFTTEWGCSDTSECNEDTSQLVTATQSIQMLSWIHVLESLMKVTPLKSSSSPRIW